MQYLTRCRSTMAKIDVLDERVSNHDKLLNEMKSDFREFKKWLMGMFTTTFGILLIELARFVFNR